MRWAAAILVVLSCFAATAAALPPIPPYTHQVLAQDPAAKKLVDSFGATSQQCFVCHNKGDKKAKGHALNDFGKAFHKHFDDKGFMAAHKEKKSEEALKLFKESWEKTLQDKNADGKSYGELLKEGGPLGKVEPEPENPKP